MGPAPPPEREPDVVPEPAIPDEAEADELFSPPPPPPLKILVVMTAEFFRRATRKKCKILII